MLWIYYEYRICTKAKASHREMEKKLNIKCKREKKIEIGGAFRKKDVLHGNKYCPYLRFHLLIVHCLLWFLFIFIYTFF